MEGNMFRTVSIATLMAPLAQGAFFAGYSAPDMAQIFAGADRSSVDQELGRPDMPYRQDGTPVRFAY
jgi:hypothetical protein